MNPLPPGTAAERTVLTAFLSLNPNHIPVIVASNVPSHLIAVCGCPGVGAYQKQMQPSITAVPAPLRKRQPEAKWSA